MTHSFENNELILTHIIHVLIDISKFFQVCKIIIDVSWTCIVEADSNTTPYYIWIVVLICIGLIMD